MSRQDAQVYVVGLFLLLWAVWLEAVGDSLKPVWMVVLALVVLNAARVLVRRYRDE